MAVAGTFIMKGGKISGNSAQKFGGGGVYLIENGMFTMEGGTIGGTEDAEKNTAASGGGVCVCVC